MRYFIELSYNGAPYHGWQRQPNAMSVQQVVEDALSVVLQIQIGITGAGRTDTGVHAIHFMAHFDVAQALDTESLVYKLNKILPKTVAIAAIHGVVDGAHARFDAIKRTYRYRIAMKKDPFAVGNSYYIHKPLEVAKMNAAAKILLEYTNFKCFSKSKTDVKTYHCRITEAFWTQQGSELVFTIVANRFLRNMVRAIVGTLIDVGLEKIPVTALHGIIESEDRTIAGYSVPAHGLYLTGVQYPKTIYK